MIVVCSQCQARFKVADEKIGPRGAKVRCSKCQTIFVVHRDVGALPHEATAPEAPAPAAPPPAAPRAVAKGGLDLDLEGEPMSGVRPSGLIADPFQRPAADPFSMPASSSAPDPFASAAAPAPAPVADPFGGTDPFASTAPPAPADPFASHDASAPPASGGGSAFGSVDPFVATVAGSASGAAPSAVTDLSDLIGRPAATPPPAAPPAPSAPEPSGILESGFDFDPSAGPSPELVAPTPVPFPAQAVAGAPEPDLALDERTPANGLPAQGAPAVPMPGAADFGGVDPFDAGMGEFGGPDDEFAAGPELAEPERPAPPPPPPPAPALSLAVEPAPAAAPAPHDVEEEATGPEEAAARGLRQRSSRFRSIAVNAISLAALLLVTVGMLAVWRGGRSATGGLFRTVIGTERATYAASHLRSGLYDRGDAPPLLFVSGQAVSRAPSAVDGLRVRVELSRKGAVLATAEGRAGAAPTPEELYATRDADGVAKLAAELERKAPAAVKPGEPVPFVVLLADPPDDVTGIALNVTVEPIVASAAGPGAATP